VVGSSAGGIEALSTLLGALPRDFPAPVVLAQHLDPARQSHLQTILQRKTQLPIVLVADSSPLTPGSVYVVPANRHVIVNDGVVQVEGDHGDRPRPSVDLLLSTAARAYGEGLVAVILTGSGSDGAVGAVEVKQAGGTVVIQNPRTARFPSMPLALPPTAVDHVVDIEQMADLLKHLATLPDVTTARESSGKALSKIVDLVSEQSAVDFHPYKDSTLLRRVSRRMTANRIVAIEDYVRFLEGHPDEARELAAALLINVTEFFRDPDAFLFLRNTVFPELIERGRARDRALRIWSVGCSTGEEAFSLVITVADLLGAELPDWNVKVFATDADEHAIAFARRGLYPANMLGPLPEEYRTRFFEPAEPGLRINKALRQMVIFGMQDIGHGVPFPRLDLVVCRNLLIYFRPELQQGVLDLFAHSLHHTGGYLFLGKAETARPSKSTFELVNKKFKVYRCLAAPKGALRQAANPRRPRAAANDAAADNETAPAGTPEAMDVGHLRRFNEVILRSMAVGLVVIDRAYRMITSNPAARRLLEIHEHGGEPDFLHAVRGIPYNDVREAIDAAFRERTPVSLPQLSLPAAADERFVQLTINRIQSDAAGGEYAVITVVDVTEMVRASRRLQVSQEEQRLLVEELSATNRRLGDLNKDLQDANEELQAANEELMLAQEEMQSTNEEFEATNEELQATNEELETNNEELQATNEELETTNEELSARSTELHDVTRILGGERVRLAEMVELAPFCMMVLKGPGLIVAAFNPASTRVLANENAFHRPFEEVFARDASLIDGVRGAYRDDRVWRSDPRKITVREGASKGAEHTFVFTAVPTHEDGKMDGLVLYAEDVTGLAGRT
jgi:two-component system CheB/CheR fusion protein